MCTRIIGIDFGTSTTVVKIYNSGQNDNIFTLTGSDGQEEIPTILFQRKSDGQLFVAAEAISQISQNVEGETIDNFKLKLISTNETEKDQAKEYTTFFLKYLYNLYVQNCNLNEYGNCDFTRVKVYVSYPAKWPSFVRNDMIDCVISAGFGTEDNVFGCDEPTAACIAALHEKTNELKAAGLCFENRTYKAMTVDMGAGTTDIVLCEYSIQNGKLCLNGKRFTYPTAESSRLCGGHEIDVVLSEYCKKYLKSIPVSGEVPAGTMAKCETEIKSWKDKPLSDGLKDNLAVLSPAFITNYIDIVKTYGIPMNSNIRQFSIDRCLFERLTQNHWNNWRKLLEEAFLKARESGYQSTDDIDIIILTGGHSQWYGVKDFFLGKAFANLSPMPFKKILKYPQALVQCAKPSQTVAMGLCLKDNAIVTATPLANNFWIQFEYEGKKSQIIKVASKGHTLPYKFTMEDISDKIQGNFLYRRKFDIKCIVYEGGELASAIKYEKSIKSPDDDFFVVIFKTVIAGMIMAPLGILSLIVDFLKGEFDWANYSNVLEIFYNIVLGAKIEISEDGVAQIFPKISVEDNSVNMSPFKI